MSIKINLLDWRQARRDRLKKQFLVLLGLGGAAAAGLVLLAWITALQTVDHQTARNDYLKGQIAETEKKIKEIQDLAKTKANLLARMKVIEQLQANRSAMVHFFDEIVNTLPDGVMLTGVKQVGSHVTLEGIADSNGRVSTYMKNLENSQWFDAPKLVVIKTSEKDRIRKSEFSLEVKAVNKAMIKPGEEDQTP
jgi:type IV pilus assembly protein PilN